VLMTGFHGGRTQVRGNRETMPIGQYPLAYGSVTISSLLRHHGYATGGFGKWGLGYPNSSGMPSRQGFDEFFGFLCQRRAHFFYPEFLFHDVKGEELRRVSLEGNVVDDTPPRENFLHPGSGPPIETAQYSADVIHREALRFIHDHRDRPFFLYYPTQIPHASMEVPDETLALYLDEDGNSIFQEDPRPSGHYVEHPMPMAAYAAMVTHLDRQVGEILDTLEALGIAERTLVIFTSDNGSHSEGGYHYSMLNSNAPFRGGKRDLYEGGIRVPTIAWWPGRIAPGTVSDHVSGFQDVLPTFTELAGMDPPPGIDGISMVPTLLGEGEQRRHEYLYWEFHEQGGKQAVRMGDWKLVRLDVRGGPEAASIELYDLSADVAESNDVSAAHPEVVERMLALMKEAHVPNEVFSLFD
jgi:arylsulfatase A